MSDSINLYAPESGNEQPESSPPAQSVPPQVSTLRKIFIGPDGLRAGWSLLIFVLIAGFLLRAVGFIANKMHLLPPKGTPVREISLGFGFLAEIIPFIVIFVATWIMSRIEKRPNSIYGLGGPRAVPLFFSGLAWELPGCPSSSSLFGRLASWLLTAGFFLVLKLSAMA